MTEFFPTPDETAFLEKPLSVTEQDRLTKEFLAAAETSVEDLLTNTRSKKRLDGGDEKYEPNLAVLDGSRLSVQKIDYGTHYKISVAAEIQLSSKYKREVQYRWCIGLPKTQSGSENLLELGQDGNWSIADRSIRQGEFHLDDASILKDLLADALEWQTNG